MSSKAWRDARRARTGRMGRSQILRKLVVALSVLSLGAAACTQDTQEGRASQPVPRETLLLGTEAGPLVVQVPSGSVLFERPGGGGGAACPVLRETLLRGPEAGPLVVQVPSGSVLFERPGAVASLGGSWLLSATPSAGSTLLQTVDGAGGAPARTL